MLTAKEKLANWSIFLILSFVWGSSFILMKEGMRSLSEYQVASVRIASAGLALLPVALRKIAALSLRQWGLIFLSGLLGSFFPAYLFCIAETRIDSSLVGFLNAFTPIFTILIGIIIFKNHLGRNKFPGVIIGFAGMTVIFLARSAGDLGHLGFSALVILATLSYAMNVNMVNRYLKDTGSLTIASVALSSLSIPAILILVCTGFFSLPLMEKEMAVSLSASLTLGILGTAVATVLFYMMLKRAGPVFSSMVTYGIPFIALFWGLIAGENISTLQIGGLIILLAGVYMATK